MRWKKTVEDGGRSISLSHRKTGVQFSVDVTGPDSPHGKLHDYMLGGVWFAV